ncbi:hypothetical protein ACS0TY_013470 [Phlomoides rotata]
MAETLNIAQLSHMIIIKLSSSNYLLWKSQVVTTLRSHILIQFVDGSSMPPSYLIDDDGKTKPNPDYTSWSVKDQKRSTIRPHPKFINSVVNYTLFARVPLLSRNMVGNSWSYERNSRSSAIT